MKYKDNLLQTLVSVITLDLHKNHSIVLYIKSLSLTTSISEEILSEVHLKLLHSILIICYVINLTHLVYIHNEML